MVLPVVVALNVTVFELGLTLSGIRTPVAAERDRPPSDECSVRREMN